ncbi:MAG: hypothetical protein C0453_04030 [Comamonadaceae bacterium]|nr:hypothetical protein [Comamonadaceae bacterium]
MPDASNWVTVSQTMVETPRVVAPTPAWDQGDTEDMPNPTPRMSRISESAAAAAAPAAMAPHETALMVPAERSMKPPMGARPGISVCPTPNVPGFAMFTPVAEASTRTRKTRYRAVFEDGSR